MVAIWSMLFCDACGNLLPRTNGPQGAMVPCDDCGSSTEGETIPPLDFNGALCLSCNRYFRQAGHFEIKAECLPFRPSLQAFSNPDPQCRRTEHRGHHTKGMPAMQKTRDVLSYQAATERRRELMGCEDRVMYLISDIVCVENLGSAMEWTTFSFAITFTHSVTKLDSPRWTRLAQRFHTMRMIS